MSKIFNLFKNKKPDDLVNQVEENVNKKLKKNPDHGDQDFYIRKKLIRKRRFKALAINLLFLFTIWSSFLFVQDRTKQEVIYQNPLSMQYVEDFVRLYYTYPLVESESVLVKPRYIEVKSATVTSYKLMDVSTSYDGDSKQYVTDYVCKFNVQIVKSDGTKKDEVMTRKITVIESKERNSFLAVNVIPVDVPYSTLSAVNVRSHLTTVKSGSVELTAEEKTRAENTVTVFLNQYNSEYEKAKFSFVEGYELPVKAIDVTYSFLSLISATRDEANNTWFITVKVEAKNETQSSDIKMSFVLNTKTNLIQKMEVFNND